MRVSEAGDGGRDGEGEEREQGVRHCGAKGRGERERRKEGGRVRERERERERERKKESETECVRVPLQRLTGTHAISLAQTLAQEAVRSPTFTKGGAHPARPRRRATSLGICVAPSHTSAPLRRCARLHSPKAAGHSGHGRHARPVTRSQRMTGHAMRCGCVRDRVAGHAPESS